MCLECTGEGKKGGGGGGRGGSKRGRCLARELLCGRILTFCTSDKLGRWLWPFPTQPESPMYSFERQVGEILRGHKNTFLEKCSTCHSTLYFYRFMDLNQFLGRVNRSNLVQSVCNTCGDICEVLWAMISPISSQNIRKSNGNNAKMAILAVFRA